MQREITGNSGGPLTNADYKLFPAKWGNGNWIKDSADYNAASWTLTGIRLPSGGAIKVAYEADDYVLMYRTSGQCSSSMWKASEKILL